LTTGRVLGLDAGERRIGVAISDPEQRLALPLRSVLRDRRGGEYETLAKLAREEAIVAIVVGLPLGLRGEAGAQAGNAQAFAGALRKKLALPVHLWDERLSTQQAERLVARGRSVRRERRHTHAVDVDALAASIILQAYLDRQRLAGSET
jgi:putative Holliday junction resolvase